jgi:hypothetical protein
VQPKYSSRKKNYKNLDQHRYCLIIRSLFSSVDAALMEFFCTTNMHVCVIHRPLQFDHITYHCKCGNYIRNSSWYLCPRKTFMAFWHSTEVVPHSVQISYHDHYGWWLDLPQTYCHIQCTSPSWLPRSSRGICGIKVRRTFLEDVHPGNLDFYFSKGEHLSQS